ncbi:flagellar basal body-associated FliL family protein [Marinobacter sp.]|uniref:flagellar basal body-associated FliL family protein n=1 Tax=Marinobacter sp. TaxID=50741 RepID=UPI0019FAD9D7|nr:flagellar basal body-associated FliL family protein [Marinobacter sp.]MBE0485309.1 flagellar basal body-associated FliL family protein [Marinobacter sp.]
MAENNVAQAPAPKGKLKLIIMLVVIIVLAIALSIVGTLWFLGDGFSGGSDQAEGRSASEPAFVASTYTNLERALVTTVQAQGRQRYVQVHVSFEATDPKALTAADTHMPLIRSKLVTVLGNSEFNELQTPDGRVDLAERMLVTVNDVLIQEGEPEIKRVLFRNFVVQ